MSIHVDRLSYPYGAPQCAGKIKSKAEDFKVVEQLGFTFTGQGEHLYLFIQKTGLTTHQLIDIIAKKTGVQSRLIGYSGLKDKHAITCQWLSVQLPGCQQMPEIADTDQFQILQHHWHEKKLKVGAHKSNQFEIVVRDIAGQIENLSSTIEQIKQFGFVNYFGEQRFGVKQDNVQQAIKILNNRHKSKRLTRTKKSLYLSALRSELFNQIVSHRIQKDVWKQPLNGDIFILSGSQSVFTEGLTDELRQRYSEFDIHCGSSLFGTGESRLSGEAVEIEDQVLNRNTDICETLLQQEIKRSYRANRAQARNLQVEFIADKNTIHLQVELDKGCYLTSLLNHFVKIER